MKRFLAGILVFVLCFSTTGIQTMAAQGQEGNTIYIRTAADLKELAKNCVVDQWSAGKTVILVNDLNLTDTEFTPIPLFQGTFDGKGHTIRGLSVKESGSIQGLFRYILKGGLVRQLNVTGSIVPDGTKEMVGGIAGKNRGTIQSCSFQGNVNGVKSIGGIVGINEADGLISNCKTSGTVEGEHGIGGVSGENYGTIIQCTNKSKVNTVYIKPEKKITDIKKTITDAAAADEEIIDITDIGGIVGWSSGIIQGSKNEGEIGYAHIGYNVGGIVGRQSGYLNHCKNKGNVFGKKDVGGIVGQIEPYSSWQFNKKTVKPLRTELDILNDLLNQAIKDAGDISNTAASGLTKTMEQVSKANDALNQLTKDAEDWGDTNITTVNQNIANVADILGDMENVSSEAAIFVNQLENAIGQYKQVMDELSEAMDEADPAWDQIEKCFDSLQAGFQVVNAATSSIQAGIQHLKKALGDQAAVRKAVSEISEGFTKLSQSAEDLKKALENLKNAAEEIKKNGTDTLPKEIKAVIELLTSNEFSQFLKTIQSSMDGFSNGLTNINNGFKSLVKQPNFSELTAAFDSFEVGATNLRNAMMNLSWAMTELKQALPYLEKAGDKIQDSMNTASEATDTMQSAFEKLSDAAGELNSICSKFKNQEVIPFKTISSSFENSREDLFDSLGNVSNSLSSLSSDIANVNGTLTEDLKKVSDQMFVVFGSLMDTIEIAKDVDTNISDYMEDVSAEGAEGITSGVVQKCINHGEVQADTNTGGIAGAISMELSFDPEDTLELSDFISQESRYLVYAVIRNCEGYAEITAKKSAVGGIVGCMDYGLVINSVGCGKVICTDGDYVGGIVGLSKGSIKNSYSRSNLTGKKYIGGIAGNGKDIKDCYAFSYIDEGMEYQGAIAGDADGTVSGNYYIDNMIGGVDGFSYVGKTNPIAYEQLMKVNGIPEAFRKIEVTFMVEDNIIKTEEVPFGGTIEKLPEVPKKGDQYWVWDEFNKEHIYYSITVNGSYQNPLTTISTIEDIPQFLVEGKFYTGQALTVSQWSPDETQLQLKKHQKADAYTLSVNNYKEKLLVRMRGEEKGILYLQDENGLKKSNYRRDGSYRVFQLENGGSFVFVEGRGRDIINEIFFTVLLIIIIIGMVMWNKHKRKKTAKSLESVEEENKSEAEKSVEGTNSDQKNIEGKSVEETNPD